jgi:HAD superfamily hydrolase (TIGR01549 family)
MRIHPEDQTAVIFDMDGTLTRPYFDFDAIRREIGLPAGTGTPILEALESMTPAERARAEAILHAHEHRAAAESELQEDALHVLETIRAAGIRVGLLTRNSRVCTEMVMTRHGLVFDCVHTREDGPVKPSPDAILRMCAWWGIAPGGVWMVGDYLFDIQAGRAAGTRTALIIGDAPVPEYAEQADVVIRRLAELLPLVV